MSYSVFVTRKKHWHDAAGGTISVAEWRSLVEADPELQWHSELGENVAVWIGSRGVDPEWVALDSGSLEAQRPSPEFREKLVSIASDLQARLVGEEGEAYASSSIILPPKAPTIGERLLSLVSSFKAAMASAVAPDPGFGVGTRVRDFRGRSGTVTRVNLRAEHGLGRIIVRYDTGHSESYSAVAHGLEPI